MTLIRPIVPFALFLLCTVPAIADASLAEMAGPSACGLDRVREIIAGAEADGGDAEMTNRLIVENTADWLPDYTAFANSTDAGDLLAATQAIGEKPTSSECKALLPYAAVAASAARVSAAGGEVVAGNVLEACEGGSNLCLPAATQKIVEQCGVALFSLPLRSTC